MLSLRRAWPARADSLAHGWSRDALDGNKIIRLGRG